MALGCDEVRELLARSGDALPLSDEHADRVAEHLDQCAECNEHLSRRVAQAVGAIPVGPGPSLPAVRRRLAEDQRKSVFLRLAAVAAAVLAILSTGWALLRHDPAATPAPRVAADRAPAPSPVKPPNPEPPQLADLKELDRNIIQCDGVLALYLQFCLSCLNRPTDEDKREYLTRSLLIFREVRSRSRSQFERGGQSVESVTRDALNDALQMISSSKLASVNFFPSKVMEFKLEPPDGWRSDHQLGGTRFRLTLQTLPLYLNFAYLRLALGADDAQMGRIEEALWFDLFVNLPKRMEDRDPTVAPKAREAVLPLLHPWQQKIFRKIVGPM
ncbi:MAG TPA: hypothetical protein VMU54_16605 [Planctomycetota bacterium]|nr:hypothetical protein [Planctomycetota bacterium]